MVQIWGRMSIMARRLVGRGEDLELGQGRPLEDELDQTWIDSRLYQVAAELIW
jgi:hypothetical protein